MQEMELIGPMKSEVVRRIQKEALKIKTQTTQRFTSTVLLTLSTPFTQLPSNINVLNARYSNVNDNVTLVTLNNYERLYIPELSDPQPAHCDL